VEIKAPKPGISNSHDGVRIDRYARVCVRVLPGSVVPWYRAMFGLVSVPGGSTRTISAME
jgi:hypothetical protein